MNRGEKFGFVAGGVLGVAALGGAVVEGATDMTGTEPINIGSASSFECPDPDWNESKQKQIAAMLCRHNAVRPTVKLVLDPVLEEAAREKLGDIVGCHDFSHTACGEDPFKDLISQLTPPWYLEENLGFGTRKLGNGHAIFGAFRKSPTHWNNIVNERVNRVGFALGHYSRLALNGDVLDDVNVWVAEFKGE